MKTKIFFSIVIAAYNAEKYILDTLVSVNNQTFDNYEVIIIDDASTDLTVCLVEEYIKNNVKFSLYCNEKNLGVARSRNIGFDKAKGEYIALLDADDLWLPRKLEKQHQLVQTMDVDITYTSYEMIDELSNSLNRVYVTKDKLSYSDLLKENYIGCSSAVFKKCITKKISMDPNYAHEDFAFWLECLRKGYTGVGLLEPLVKYRILDGSRSHNKRKAFVERFRILHHREKISIFYSVYVLLFYSINGFKKYWRLNSESKS